MTKPSLSYWSIAVLGLLWHLMGCMNYLSQTAAASLGQLPEPYQGFIAQRPVWASAAFIVAAFAGAVGCILLLLRRRVAVQLFGLSLAAWAVVLAYTAVVLGMAGNVILSLAVSLIVSVVFLVIARAARARGWLR